MHRERIVVNPMNDADHLETVVDPNGVGHHFISGIGVRQNNEMSDYRINAGDVVKYHVHDHGYELFIVTAGSVDAILGGKRAVAKVGDMLLVRPFVPHAFRYLEDGTIWHEVVQDLGLWEICKTMDRVIQNCPEKLEDRAWMKKYQTHHGRVDYVDLPVMETTQVKPEELPGFSGKGQCYKSFKVPGIECRCKYPKWDWGGLKEVWEFVLDKDVSVDWGEHYWSHELFVVRQGKVKVEVQGYETKYAGPEDIISIPDYTTHRLTAMEQGTIVQDLNCQYDMFLMMEDIEIVKRTTPEKFNQQYLMEVLERHECPITEITGIFKK